MPTASRSSQSPWPADRFRGLLGGALIAAMVFAAYYPAVRGAFLWDDLVLVEQNPLVAGETNLRSVWFSGDFPLATVGMWLQWLAFGKNPTGYHIVNLSLHTLSALLLWRVLLRLRVPAAWLAAAIFAVHPVCVASVAWISELKSALALPCCLASVWCYLAFEDERASGRTGRARWLYRLSIVAFLFGLLAKTAIVMLPVWLLGCAWWRRGRVTWRDVLQVGPQVLLALGFGLMTIWFQTHQAIQGVVVQEEGLGGRLAGAGLAFWFYLGKVLLPLNLCMIYPRWTLATGSLLAWLPLLMVLLTFALGACCRRTWCRAVLFALGSFVILLLPALGFFDMYFLVFSRVSDHLQYVALPAIAALVAAAMTCWSGARWRGASGAALLLALAVLTWQRARVFVSDEALWMDTVAKNPAAWTAHNNLGCNLAERKDLAGAIEHFEISLRLNPRNAGAQRNLAKALALCGRIAEAEPHFRLALELKPDDREALTAYAGALGQQQRREEAISLFRKAQRLKPDVATRLQLAPLLAGVGRPRDAVAEWRAVLANEPGQTEALNNLAWVLATSPDASLRNGAEAVRLAEQACRLAQPPSQIFVAVLAAAYAEAGQFTNAVATAQKAITLARDSGDVSFMRLNQQLLGLYAAGKPYHEPPPESQGRNP